MFIKHLTNKEYQIHTKSSPDNKDPNVFSDYYLIRISNDEERIINKKDLEKILKKKKISKKLIEKSERLKNEYIDIENVKKMQEL